MRSALHMTCGAFASVLVTTPGLATTWVVDDNGGPGIDFVTIQAAVDAATDGDVIEVRDGAYAGFTIDGKSLVVIADVGPGESARVSATVLVRNVAAAGAVELDGLVIGSPWTGTIGVDSLQLRDSAGSVRVVDCVVTGRDTDCAAGVAVCGGGAARVQGCASVVLLRCAFEGGVGTPAYHCSSEDLFGCPTGNGITASASQVEVLSCTTGGGDAICGFFALPAYSGGHGALVVDGSTLFADGSTFVAGGTTGAAPCPPDGSALRVVGSACTIKDAVIAGGVQGPVGAGAMAPLCVGTYEECPCGNAGVGVAGCDHATGLGGGLLAGTGVASVASDTVQLALSGLEPSTSPAALLFQGTLESAATPFGDGLRCTSGTIRRLKAKLASGGTVVYGTGGPGDPPLSVAGQVPAGGGARVYQVWYRNNPAAFCTSAPFNLSNGVEIAWAP